MIGRILGLFGTRARSEARAVGLLRKWAAEHRRLHEASAAGWPDDKDRDGLRKLIGECVSEGTLIMAQLSHGLVHSDPDVQKEALWALSVLLDEQSGYSGPLPTRRDIELVLDLASDRGTELAGAAFSALKRPCRYPELVSTSDIDGLPDAWDGLTEQYKRDLYEACYAVAPVETRLVISAGCPACREAMEICLVRDRNDEHKWTGEHYCQQWKKHFSVFSHGPASELRMVSWVGRTGGSWETRDCSKCGASLSINASVERERTWGTCVACDATTVFWEDR